LGDGNSSHPDDLLVAQQTMQVKIIHRVIGMLRAGTVPNAALSGKKFCKAIFVRKFFSEPPRRSPLNEIFQTLIPLNL